MFSLPNSGDSCFLVFHRNCTHTYILNLFDLRHSQGIIQLLFLYACVQPAFVSKARHGIFPHRIFLFQAKDVTMERTATKHAPWWIIPSTVKKEARLNCISHVLSSIDYEPQKEYENITLPPRGPTSGYVIDFLAWACHVHIPKHTTQCQSEGPTAAVQHCNRVHIDGKHTFTPAQYTCVSFDNGKGH